MKKLALLLMVLVTALPGNRALAESEATVPLVAPNHEDYPDDALDLPGSEELPVEELFGDRLGEVWIDRSVSPSVLKVAVVAPTPDDVADLARLAQDNPRVVLHATPYGERTLRQWKSATQDVLRRHALAASWYEIRGHEGVLVVTTAAALSEAVVAEILSVVPAEAVRFAVGTSELLHGARTDYPPYEAGLSMTLTKLTGIDPTLAAKQTGACTTGFTMRNSVTGLYYGTSAGHCAAVGSEVRVGSRYVSDVNRNMYVGHDPVFSDSLRYPISPVHATPRMFVAENSHRTVRGKFIDSDLRVGTRLCFQGVASAGGNCGNIYLIRDNHTINDPVWGSKEIVEDFCVDVSASPGDSGGPVYRVNTDQSAKAAGLVSSRARIEELRPIDPGSAMMRREPKASTGMCFTSVARLEAFMDAAVLQG